MFEEVETKYKGILNKRKMLSYSYLLKNILQILKKEEHAKYFKLLKCRWKLREHDSICQRICMEKGWEFYSSI